MKTTPQEHKDLVPIPWKSTVTAPADAKRPNCSVILSRNGVDGELINDTTDEQDWLCVIAYEKQS